MLNAEDIQLGRSVNWVNIELEPHAGGTSLLEIFSGHQSFWDGQIVVHEEEGKGSLVLPAVKNINLGFLNDTEGPMSLFHYINIFRTAELAQEYAEQLVNWISQRCSIGDLTVFSLPNPREGQNPLEYTPERTAQIIVPTLADLLIFKEERSGQRPFRPVSQL